MNCPRGIGNWSFLEREAEPRHEQPVYCIVRDAGFVPREQSDPLADVPVSPGTELTLPFGTASLGRICGSGDVELNGR